MLKRMLTEISGETKQDVAPQKMKNSKKGPSNEKIFARKHYIVVRFVPLVIDHNPGYKS